ncbi:hypothetical protein ACJMK2_006719 [Sinanodonta woodiana]|uniref:Disintegrin domain-containing protein n=1 Tax=Sinanodonta woodiana TaxID=1069815 RepID=A0ABD3VWT7_SINWO
MDIALKHTSPTNWSSCSHVALSEAFDMGMDYCLQNRPDKVFEGPICGNSFIETGEECDCGLPQSCDNKCCNATTCKLTPGSVCATGQCCDFNTCKYKAAATLCRPSKGECDLSEFCWGDKEFCPDDVFVQDSVPCLGGQSYCYNGECKTHTSQCKLLWGSTGRVSDPVCFKHLNGNGSKHGNCGYNWTTNSYKPCDKDDVDCGLLHCVHQNEKLMFWKDNFAHATPATFLTIGSTTYICRGAMLDVGVDMPDPGMVPDGAKCGDRKICKDKKCVYLSHLNLPGCPNGCNEGVCNSKGNCHCHEGYAPPNCDVPGTGGSIDSGPISMHSSNSLLVGLLVFFLVVIPLLGISIFLVYYFRRKLRSWCNVHIMTFKSSRPSRPQRPNRPPPRPTRTPERSPSDVSTTSQGRRAKVPVKNGNVYIEISGPVLTGSTNKDSHKDIQPSPKPRPSVPLRPNPPVPRPASPMKCAIEMTPQFNPVLLATTDESLQPAQKRELKREISSPVLISTTDRRSKHLIKVDSTVAHDIIPPPLPPHVKTVERSESDRSMAKRPLPPRPTSLPPQDNVSLHDVEEDSLQARKSMINASRMPLRPPPPPMKTDATNESNPMEEISEPKMKTSQPKSNMMKLNTQSKKGLPKTSVFRTNSDSSATKSGESKVANTSPAVKIKSDPKSNAGQWTIANKPIFKPKQRQASPKMGQSSLVSCDSTENPPNNRKESTESIEDDPNAGAASVAGLRKMFEDQKKALISGSAGEKELSRSNSKGKDGNPPPKLAPKPGKNIHTIDV